METGATIGFRGPFGNTFPLDEWKGKNLLFIAGGIALPPMRCVIWNALDLRENFNDVTIIYGAKSVADLVYKEELREWDNRPDVRLVTTVDPGGETPDWKGRWVLFLLCWKPLLPTVITLLPLFVALR